MYDPKIARFMQEDTYTGDPNDPLSLNLYTYCHNEPIRYTDPSGHKELEDYLYLPNDAIMQIEKFTSDYESAGINLDPIPVANRQKVIAERKQHARNGADVITIVYTGGLATVPAAYSAIDGVSSIAGGISQMVNAGNDKGETWNFKRNFYNFIGKENGDKLYKADQTISGVIGLAGFAYTACGKISIKVPDILKSKRGAVLIPPWGSGGKKVTVYHYTNKAGYNAITSDKIFKLKTSKPGKGHPEGVYLTTKSPEELMKTNNGFKKHGITSSKSEYFFEFEIDEGLLKTFKGDRSEFIKFTDDVINIDRSKVLRYGQTPKKK